MIGRGRHNLVVLALVPLLLAAGGFLGQATLRPTAASAAATVVPPNLPAGFVQTQLAGGLKNPTAFAFAANGDIYITLQSGPVMLYHKGAVQATPVGVLSTSSTDEKGVLGIALDPNFLSNGYIYLSYTTLSLHAQLSRFTVKNGTFNLGTEKVFMTGNQLQNLHHSANDLHVGPDGKLWWSVGDNVPTISNGLTLTNIYGKILRFNLDGSIPADNPFLNVQGAVPAIYAYGLRNPFRFTFLPDGRAMSEDTGSSYWEELNTIQRGGNYGWSYYEGNCGSCGYINPAYAYGHLPTDAAASAIAAYSGKKFPNSYSHVVFVGDYVRRDIEAITFDPTYTTELSQTVFSSAAGSIADLQEGPDGSLYYVSIFEGTFTRISASGPFPPTASASASRNAGMAPFNAQFSSAGSTDPFGLPLSYRWNFGDGSPTSTAANPSHLYTRNGAYTVTLSASNGKQAGTATMQIVVGHTPPAAVITSPAQGATYRAGDTISFGGTASDVVDGVLPASAYTWSVDFISNGFAQPFYTYEVPAPFFTAAGVQNGSFTIPRDVSNTASTFYRVTLKVVDSLGLTSTTTQDIKPALTTWSVNTNVPGAGYFIDGTWHTQPYTTQDVVGVPHVLMPVPAQTIASTRYRFMGWADGSALSDTFNSPASGATYTANLEAVGPVPSPWQSVDVGSPPLPGLANYSGASNTFYVDGSGADTYAANDQFHYVEQPLNGDGTIIARVRYQTNPDPWTKAGVMIKQSATSGAPWVDVLTTPNVNPTNPNINGVGCTINGCASPLPPVIPSVGNGVHMDYSPNGDKGVTAAAALAGYASPNEWVKLQRVGNTFFSWYSTDGANWKQIGNTTVAMNSSATVGLFVTARDVAQYASVAFDNVQVTSSSQLPSLPAPWLDADIGSPAVAGAAGYSGGVFTVNGAGADIYGTADEFNYAYQSLAGDGSISARVTSQTNTNAWAKTGLMLRGSTDPGAPNYGVFVSPGNGITVQVRTTLAGTTAKWAAAPGVIPTYLKLTRSADTFSAYSSGDGITWTLVPGSRITMTLPATLLEGLPVTSHNAGAISTATLDNVVLTSGQSPGCVAPWTCADIGSPTPAGNASFDPNTGTWTINAGGVDIGGTTDSFGFAWQPLSGDGSISARVVSQTNTSTTAKAGVMFRQTTDPASPEYAVLVTPATGIKVQVRSTLGGTTTKIANPGGAAPAYVKATNTNGTFTAYTSPDGVNWTLIPGSTFTMNLGPTLLEGLAVTSHNTGSLCTVTMDSVVTT